MKVEMVNVDELKISEWAATYILRPDLLTLAVSLTEYGFIQPILVRKSNNEIIDGNQRFLLATRNPHIKEKVGGLIPVYYVDCNSSEAMMMHLQMNRGRGTLQVRRVSNIIRKLSLSKAYGTKDFSRLLSMKMDELELLLDGTLIKMRKIPQHTYSRAWVPVEVPAGDEQPVSIERPPNPDR
jgi:hypothetical protein